MLWGHEHITLANGPKALRYHTTVICTWPNSMVIYIWPHNAMEDVSPTLEIGLVQRCVGNRPELAGQLEVIGVATVQVTNLHKNMCIITNLC